MYKQHYECIKCGKFYKNNFLLFIGHLGDAARCMADLQHDENSVRRSLIMGVVNEDIKDALKESPADGDWLFGPDIGDKIKSALAAKKTSEIIRPPTVKATPAAKQGKNFKAPRSKDYALRSGGAGKSESNQASYYQNHQNNNARGRGRRRNSGYHYHQDDRRDNHHHSSRRRY